MTGRRIEESFFRVLMITSTILIAGGLCWIVAVILWRGARSLNLAMVTQLPKGGYYIGGEGGILNAIVGSLLLGFLSTVVAGAIALPVCFMIQGDYAGKGRVAALARLSLDVMWGVPSIVYGAFAYTVMVYVSLGASLLAGIVALTLVQLPIVARAIDEVMQTVPRELKEAAYAIGATRFDVATKVISRQCLPGIFAGLLLGFGRGIGDAASIILTAGYTDSLPHRLTDPVGSLPLAVFFQLGSPDPEVQARAYAAAFILLVIVLLASIATQLFTRRFSRHVVR